MRRLPLRQVALQHGMSGQLIETLVKMGVLRVTPGHSTSRPEIDPESISNLVEGEHYVRCLECGAWVALITGRHLKRCSGVATQGEYLLKHPEAQVISQLSIRRKTKTPEQRQAQSDKLKARFKTPEGEVTRQQIAQSSQQLMLNGGLERVTAQLRALNEDPAQRAQRGLESKARWENTGIRDQVQQWHQEHREESLASAANARRHIKRKRTKLHARLKEALVRAGLETVTEYEIGYYSIDEAVPSLKVSIEADGCWWHGCEVCGFSGMPNTKQYDHAKESFLKNRGWTIFHIPGHEILADADACAVSVVRAVESIRNKEACHGL